MGLKNQQQRQEKQGHQQLKRVEVVNHLKVKEKVKEFTLKRERTDINLQPCLKVVQEVEKVEKEEKEEKAKEDKINENLYKAFFILFYFYFYFYFYIKKNLFYLFLFFLK